MKVFVVGLGYVGIPLAASLARNGHAVIGIDIDPARVEAVNAGVSPLLSREEELARLLNEVTAQGALTATESYDDVGGVDAFLICVDTPVDPVSKEPILEALEAALREVSKHLSKGALVSIESTLPPGTMAARVQPLLEAGSDLRVSEDFHLVHCPERVTPGRLLHNLTTLDRVLGAEDEASQERARELYRTICDGTLHPATWIEAELSKTVENAYRDVQLAFANEVALICQRHGADVLRVRELVNSGPGRFMLYPGPGVGGHCLPKDTWLLLAGHEDEARLLPAARAVNEGMIQAVVDLITGALEGEGVELQEARILLVGGAYRENIAESRNSPGLQIYEALAALGAEVRLYDPHILEIEGIDLRRHLGEAVRGVDCAVLVTVHDEDRDLDWQALGQRMRHRALVDCRGIVSQDVRSKGFTLTRLGRP